MSSRQIDGILENPLIRAATLTGSDAAGRAVASKAGAMLKKTVLELGGSDAYVVLDDADLEKAATISVKGRLVNGGQSCIAAKRFIVTEKLRRQVRGAVRRKDARGPIGRSDGQGDENRPDGAARFARRAA